MSLRRRRNLCRGALLQRQPARAAARAGWTDSAVSGAGVLASPRKPAAPCRRAKRSGTAGRMDGPFGPPGPARAERAATPGGAHAFTRSVLRPRRGRNCGRAAPPPRPWRAFPVTSLRRDPVMTPPGCIGLLPATLCRPRPGQAPRSHPGHAPFTSRGRLRHGALLQAPAPRKVRRHRARRRRCGHELEGEAGRVGGEGGRRRRGGRG